LGKFVMWPDFRTGPQLSDHSLLATYSMPPPFRGNCTERV
jgi:hypothetical protein